MTAPNERTAYKAIDAVLRTILRRTPATMSQRAALEWGYRFRPPPRTVRTRSGMRFHFEEVDFLPLMVHYTGTFEPAVMKLLGSILRPGDTVLDVGANVGIHTLECWHLVGKRGRVISIEASPQHAAATRRNLQANDLPTDNVINVAVGDHEGEATLGRPTRSNHGMHGINGGPKDAFTIPLKRIDDLLADVPSLALIKMDIEGSELAALRGAVETLRRHKPAVVIELNDIALARCGASSDDVVALLHEHGYAGRLINSGEAIMRGQPHKCDECLFTHHGASARM